MIKVTKQEAIDKLLANNYRAIEILQTYDHDGEDSPSSESGEAVVSSSSEYLHGSGPIWHRASPYLLEIQHLYIALLRDTLWAKHVQMHTVHGVGHQSVIV